MVDVAASAEFRAYRPYDDAEGTYAAYRSAITQTACADYEPDQIEAWVGPEEIDPKRIDLGQWDAGRQAAHTFVAVAAGRVAGFTDLLDDGLLDMLFVHHDFGGRGMARSLVQTVKREAVRAGLTTLHTHASRTARPAFEHFGFRVVAYRPDNLIRGQMVPNYEMRCDLVTDEPHRRPSAALALCGCVAPSPEGV